jgi:hypothetical protein
MTGNRRTARLSAPFLVALWLLASCTDHNSDSSVRATSMPASSTTMLVVTGLSDDQLIAIARQTLAAAGRPVGADRESVVKRWDTGVEVAFPTRTDLPPRIGGESHVYLDPVSGVVQRIVRTR